MSPESRAAEIAQCSPEVRLALVDLAAHGVARTGKRLAGLLADLDAYREVLHALSVRDPE